MSRPLRIEYSGSWYHVMNRGRWSKSIFPDKQDYEEFQSLRNMTEKLKSMQEKYKKILA